MYNAPLLRREERHRCGFQMWRAVAILGAKLLDFFLVDMSLEVREKAVRREYYDNLQPLHSALSH